MKQCDRGLSPLAPPFAISSSSLSFAASESDPDDSFWGDFTFDFSFLTSDDHKPGLDDGEDSTSVPPPKAEEYGLAGYGLGNKGNFARPVKDHQRFDLRISKREDSDSSLKLPKFLESDSTTRNSPFTSRVDSKDKSSCSGKVPVRKDVNGSNSSPLFAKMLKSSDQDDAEVDSPCWRGTQSHKSLSCRRSSEDLNSLYRLNPLAPQFIPSSAKKDLAKNDKGFEENTSSSLKRSLSSNFPPSSGEFSISDPSEAGIPQDSGQTNRIEDESLGLICQDSVSKAMSISDISNQFQMPKKLDPLAPVFVPASAKLSAVVHEKHRAADHMIANVTNALSSYSEDMFLNNVEVATHSSEVDHSLMNPYANYVHESGRSYSFNPRLGSQVKISESTKLDSSSNKSPVSRKLNPLAPQFSLADTKQKVYACETANDLPSHVNTSVLFSPLGYRSPKEPHPGLAQSSVYVVDPNAILPVKDKKDFEHVLPFHIFDTSVSSSSSDVKSLSDFGHRHGCSTSLPSPKLDVKKLLTMVHGLSELLTSSESSDSLNEQDLDLINCTIQNLNAYANSRVQAHTGNYSSAVHNSCDLNSLPHMCKVSVKDHPIPKAENMSANLDVKRKAKYYMFSGEIEADSHFECVTKENGFVKVLGNYQTEEQISPQVFFYKSLWLKAKADRSLMEYESFLSKTRA